MSDRGNARVLLVLAAQALVIGAVAIASAELSPASPQAPSSCETCHRGIEPMHTNRSVNLACADCHGGDASVAVSAGVAPGDATYEKAKRAAHVAPRQSEVFTTSANPVRSYTALNRESFAFIRFFNPGDLRVAGQTCGRAGCHGEIVTKVESSMMTHGSMLWAAALYNNGSFPLKDARFGESYDSRGTARRLVTDPPPDPAETLARGWLFALDPLPRYEVSQPGNILRIFERGGRRPIETGLPERDEEPGRPARRLSGRGLGTLNRTDPVFLNLQKTRLLDPTLNFAGTNDHAGDYRASGCTGCHVVYANDSAPSHSGPWASFGHRGTTSTADPTIPRDEPGHPIRHQLTRAIPSSQCIVCHMHPGTNVLNSYLGTIWWDNETDGAWMYARDLRSPALTQRTSALSANPEGAASRGKWSDPRFLDEIESLNPRLQRSQFAGFASHGFVFRNVFETDRRGGLLDANGRAVSWDDPERFSKAVHLADIHLEKGMHCVDCHFEQDVHGTGRLHGEVRAAIEIDCVDCHGTIERKATLLTTAAAGGGGRTLAAGMTPSGRRRFFWGADGRLFQRSMLDPEVEWEVVQVRDTIDPTSAHYSEASRLAKTLRRDGASWGDVPSDPSQLAHSNESMTCFSCHTSWATSCFGCHLPMTANLKKPALHNEGDVTRNYSSYSFQTIRDDIFMLGRDGTVTGGRVAPIRSACAVNVSSQNTNREWVYAQQQTVSAEGFSGVAFSPFVPHTVRAKETRACTDCHLSAAGDNNAWMASVLMQGTGLMNFMGRYVYVGEGSEGGDGKGGFDAIAVTERDEPQAVIGSSLHRLAYPDSYAEHERRAGRLAEAAHQASDGGEPIRSLQLRGEYLYAACGRGGLRVYDVANLDNKGFSERTVTAPVSPLGQRLHVPTKDATAVASPSTMALDPLRSRRPENQEGPVHPVYGYLYVTDREEGLVIVGAATLLDGDPTNNFLRRAATFNPDGLLRGASCIAIAGTTGYVGCDRGLVILSLDDPRNPRVLAIVGEPAIRRPRAVTVQFRYAFVADDDGLDVIDVTDPETARPAASLPFDGINDIYVGRTYVYLAAGSRGLAIVDIERPETPRIVRTFDANGAIDDARAVKLGITNASLFAYIADGRNGLRVVQLASPEETPEVFGFSPEARSPRLVATYPTRAPAIALSRGLDRDRAVDESGNQLGVFGRRGARPFNAEEMARLTRRGGAKGPVYTVSNSAPAPPRAFALPPLVTVSAEEPVGEPYWTPIRRRTDEGGQ